MPTEIKLTLTGYCVEDALPDESGNYLCCTDLCSWGKRREEHNGKAD